MTPRLYDVKQRDASGQRYPARLPWTFLTHDQKIWILTKKLLGLAALGVLLYVCVVLYCAL